MAVRLIVTAYAESDAAEFEQLARERGLRVTRQERVGRRKITDRRGFKAAWNRLLPLTELPKTDRRHVTLEEAARHLNCGASTLSKLRKSGRRRRKEGADPNAV